MVTGFREEGIADALELVHWIARGQMIDTALNEYAMRVQETTAPYVSAPAGSTYRRTGTQGRGWYRRNASNNRVEIGNRVPYSGYVQQRSTQAWMHRQHGWHTIEDRAEASTNVATFYRAIERQLRSR